MLHICEELLSILNTHRVACGIHIHFILLVRYLREICEEMGRLRFDRRLVHAKADLYVRLWILSLHHVL